MNNEQKEDQGECPSFIGCDGEDEVLSAFFSS